MKEIKMPRADKVIADYLGDMDLLHGKGEDRHAKAILDALHAAGFHITEPSDKVFNQPDPLRDVFAGQAMASLMTGEAYDAASDYARAAYIQADAMMKEREK
jgi:hypothetical protein